MSTAEQIVDEVEAQVAEENSAEVEAPAEEAPAEEAAAKPTKKAPAEPKPCLCRSFLLIDPEDKDAEFNTECESTSRSGFAQGHDAKLVSFLVQGERDGYKPLRTDGENGARIAFTGAGHAAASVSEALGRKADKALVGGAERDALKATAKAEREAARDALRATKLAAKEAEKAQKAEAKQAAIAEKAKVVAGSQEGDSKAKPSRPEPEDGEEAVTIKIGRTEIPATLNADKTEVRWIDASGKPQTRPSDTVRVLTEA
jgi:hypothetical protein